MREARVCAAKVGSATAATLTTLTAQNSAGQSSPLTVKNSQVTLSVSERPVFVTSR